MPGMLLSAPFASTESVAEGPAPWANALGIGIAVVILALCLWAIVWSFRRRAHDRRAASVDWTRPEDYTLHHTVRWRTDPSSFTPEPRHRALAVATMFSICGDDPWEDLRHHDVDAVRAQITEAWGVRTRPDLLSTVHWLLTQGHRVLYAEEVQSVRELDDLEAADVELGLSEAARSSEDAAEQLWRFRRARAGDREIHRVRFDAWDLVRCSMLCRAGATTGLLSDAEALDTMALVAAELRGCYASWAEMGEHFNRGRWFWHGVSGLEERQTDAHDHSRLESLLAPRTGPWSRVPWELDPPSPRVLLADAMIAEELVQPVPPDWIGTPTGVWFDSVVRERTGAGPL